MWTAVVCIPLYTIQKLIGESTVIQPLAIVHAMLEHSILSAVNSACSGMNHTITLLHSAPSTFYVLSCFIVFIINFDYTGAVMLQFSSFTKYILR
jgi:hypothetical protein